MTNTPTLQMPEHISLSWVGQVLQSHWQPLYLGSLVLGLIFALLGYLATNSYWHWWVRHNWRKRQEARRNRANKD
jgi:uncharacterized protein (DUF2062 family)